MIFCLVRTDPNARKQEGISFLLIDMHTPGISVRPIIMLDEEHEVNNVFFDNVKVPVQNLIGEENKGWTYAKYLLGHERINIAAVGRAKRGPGPEASMLKVKGTEVQQMLTELMVEAVGPYAMRKPSVQWMHSMLQRSNT